VLESEEAQMVKGVVIIKEKKGVHQCKYIKRYKTK
jgi:hypothetical protein